MADPNIIANLTHHQNITDALLNTMGECMAVQQALLHIPPYDGKNLSLRNFLQDVENGLAICPEGIHDAFFKGVVAKLRDTARDAIGDTRIVNINQLKDALKRYFAPRKNYSQYCSEIQGVRMRRGETVMEYYGRIKAFIEGAKASLKETFEAAQVPHMIAMVEGIALESFKRGLSDDLLYALSVQAPETLDNAVIIAQRIERDMLGNNERKGAIHILKRDEDNNVNLHQEDQYSPWNYRRTRNQDSRFQNNQPRRVQNFSNNPTYRNRFPSNNQPRAYDMQNSASQQGYRQGNPNRTRYPNKEVTYANIHSHQPMQPFPQFPPMQTLPYPFMPYQYMIPPYPAYNMQAMPPIQQNVSEPTFTPQNHLNSQATRRMDAPTNEQTTPRPPTIKFISAMDLLDAPKEKEPHH